VLPNAVADCAPLDKPSNGVVSFEPAGSTQFRSRAVYKCDSGFTIQGNASRECQANETWSGVPPTCSCKFIVRLSDTIVNYSVVVSPSAFCPPLKTPGNGSVQLSRGLEKYSIAKYSCLRKFKIKDGHWHRKCLSNRQWTGKAPICRSEFLAFNLRVPSQTYKDPGVSVTN